MWVNHAQVAKYVLTLFAKIKLSQKTEFTILISMDDIDMCIFIRIDFHGNGKTLNM